MIPYAAILGLLAVTFTLAPSAFAASSSPFIPLGKLPTNTKACKSITTESTAEDISRCMSEFVFFESGRRRLTGPKISKFRRCTKFVSILEKRAGMFRRQTPTDLPAGFPTLPTSDPSLAMSMGYYCRLIQKGKVIRPMDDVPNRDSDLIEVLIRVMGMRTMLEAPHVIDPIANRERTFKSANTLAVQALILSAEYSTNPVSTGQISKDEHSRITGNILTTTEEYYSAIRNRKGTQALRLARFDYPEIVDLEAEGTLADISQHETSFDHVKGSEGNVKLAKAFFHHFEHVHNGDLFAPALTIRHAVLDSEHRAISEAVHKKPRW